jgi:hypothetical protein
MLYRDHERAVRSSSVVTFESLSAARLLHTKELISRSYFSVMVVRSVTPVL